MKRILIALVLTAALPAAVSAAELSYNYVEGGRKFVDLQGGNDADGYLVGGSAALGEQFHIFGSYSNLSPDIQVFQDDADLWRLGLGWNTHVSDRSDLVVRANYAELNTRFGNADAWEAEVGLRSALTDRFETYVGLGYSDGDGDGEVLGKLGAQFKFNPRWGIVADAAIAADDGANEYFVGPRFTF